MTRADTAHSSLAVCWPDKEWTLRERPILALVATGIALGACSDGTTTTAATSSSCEFSGITARDASGLMIGPEDPDDWCDSVAAMPNPASQATVIRFSITRDQHVQIWVRSAVQDRVRTLVDESRPAGVHAVTWDMTSDSGASVDRGIYCVTVLSDEFACSGDIDVR